MKRTLSLIITIFLLFSLLSACSSDTHSTPNTPEEPAVDSNGDSTHTTESPESISYPLSVDDGTTIEYWWPMPAQVLQKYEKGADLPLFSRLENATGVHIDVNLVNITNAATDFTLMLTAEDYPDLWGGIFTTYYTNGWDHAIEENVIMPLNDYLQYMPNLSAILSGDEAIRKQSYTDNGYLAGIPSMRVINDGHEAQRPWYGYVVRQDWLNELGMALPDTYEALETLLLAMQTNYSSAANPMYFSGGSDASTIFNDPTLYGGYGVTADWIVKNGQVVYSPLEDGYRQYVEMLNHWYETGLISPDFVSVQMPWLDLAESTKEEVGVYPIIYTWFDSYRTASSSESFDLTALEPLKIHSSDTVHIQSSTAGNMSSAAAAICYYSEISNSSASGGIICSVKKEFFWATGALKMKPIRFWTTDHINGSAPSSTLKTTQPSAYPTYSTNSWFTTWPVIVRLTANIAFAMTKL